MGRSALSDAQADAIRRAASRADVSAAMGRLYQDLDAEISARQPVCRNRGACCRFDEYGHSLFVTALEAAYFLASHPAAADTGSPGYPAPLHQPPSSALPGGCPFQVNGLCTTRAGRPVGCRIFFCDPGSQHWQGPMSEVFLERLRRLHEELGVPYTYAEWRAVLQALRPA